MFAPVRVCNGVVAEIEVLDLIVDQVVLVERRVVEQVGLIDVLGLLERLHLPVGIAPLVLANADAERQHVPLLPGANRGQRFSVAFFIRRQQRGAELADASDDLVRLLDLEREAVRTGSAAPIRLVVAGFGNACASRRAAGRHRNNSRRGRSVPCEAVHREFGGRRDRSESIPIDPPQYRKDLGAEG